MTTTVIIEWIKRLIGFGLAAAAAPVAAAITKATGDAGTGLAAGACVGTVGAAVVTKAIPWLVPTAAKVEAANSMPAPVKKIPNVPGPGGVGKGGL